MEVGKKVLYVPVEIRNDVSERHVIEKPDGSIVKANKWGRNFWFYYERASSVDGMKNNKKRAPKGELVFYLCRLKYSLLHFNCCFKILENSPLPISPVPLDTAVRRMSPFGSVFS